VATGYATKVFNGLPVFFTPELDGGGSGYGQDFVHFVRANFPRQRRVFEWCAGAGFIGFSLLAHDLCDTLCLADINPAAVEACRHTITENGLHERATVYQSDCLRRIPLEERWDLVVANPPHSGTDEMIREIKRPTIIYQDVGWRLHEEFFSTVGRFLAPESQLLIQENFKFSSVATFWV
jgi:methylase of polypeptide subunit release factors